MSKSEAAFNNESGLKKNSSKALKNKKGQLSAIDSGVPGVGVLQPEADPVIDSVVSRPLSTDLYEEHTNSDLIQEIQLFEAKGFAEQLEAIRQEIAATKANVEKGRIRNSASVTALLNRLYEKEAKVRSQIDQLGFSINIDESGEMTSEKSGPLAVEATDPRSLNSPQIDVSIENGEQENLKGDASNNRNGAGDKKKGDDKQSFSHALSHDKIINDQSVDATYFGNPFKKLDSRENLEGVEADIAEELRKQGENWEQPAMGLEKKGEEKEGDIKKTEPNEKEGKTKNQKKPKSKLPNSEQTPFDISSATLKVTDFDSLLRVLEDSKLFSDRDIARLKTQIEAERVNLFGEKGFVRKRAKFFSDGADVGLGDIRDSAVRGKIWKLLLAEWEKRYPEEARKTVGRAKKAKKAPSQELKELVVSEEEPPLAEAPQKTEEIINRGIEIEYSGSPIDIEVGGKKLRIIDVADGDLWNNARYIVVDPAVYDTLEEDARKQLGHPNVPDEAFKRSLRSLVDLALLNENRKGVKGYKAIHPEEMEKSFDLGSEDGLGRFEFPEGIAPKHVRIGMRGGKIFIEDLGGGTKVSYGVPKAEAPETEREAHAKKEKQSEDADFESEVRTAMLPAQLYERIRKFPGDIHEDGHPENVWDADRRERLLREMERMGVESLRMTEAEFARFKAGDDPSISIVPSQYGIRKKFLSLLEEARKNNALLTDERTQEEKSSAPPEKANSELLGQQEKVKEAYESSLEATRRYNKDVQRSVLEKLHNEYEEILAKIEENAKAMIVVEEEKRAAQEMLEAKKKEIEEQRKSLRARLGSFFSRKKAGEDVDVNLLRELAQYQKYFDVKIAESDRLQAEHNYLVNRRDELKLEIDELQGGDGIPVLTDVVDEDELTKMQVAQAFGVSTDGLEVVHGGIDSAESEEGAPGKEAPIAESAEQEQPAEGKPEDGQKNGENTGTSEIPQFTLEGYASLGIGPLEVQDAFRDIASLNDQEHDRVFHRVKYIKELAGVENDMLLANIAEIVRSIRYDLTEEQEKIFTEKLGKYRTAYALERANRQIGEAGLNYYLSLLSLKDVKRGMLEKSSLKEKELKQRIGEIAAFFSNEKNLLVEAETVARAERRGILGLVEKIGQGWNKVKLRYKLGFAAAVAGLSIAVPPAGAAVMLMKRLAGGAGTFVALDAIFERGIKKLQERREEKVMESRLFAIGEMLANEKQDDRSKKAIEQLSDFIDFDIRSLDSEIKKRRMMGRARKVVAFTAGMAVAVLPSLLQEVSAEAPQGEPMTVQDYYQQTSGVNDPEAIVAPATPNTPVFDAPVEEADPASLEDPGSEPIGVTTPEGEDGNQVEMLMKEEAGSSGSQGAILEAQNRFAEGAGTSVTEESVERAGGVESHGTLVDTSELGPKSLSSGPKPDDMISLQRGGVMVGSGDAVSEAGASSAPKISDATQAEIAAQEAGARAEANISDANIAKNILDSNTAANQAYDEVIYGASPEAVGEGIANQVVASEASVVPETSIAGDETNIVKDVSFEGQDTGGQVADQSIGDTGARVETSTENVSGMEKVIDSVESKAAREYLAEHPEQVQLFQERAGHYEVSILGGGEERNPFLPVRFTDIPKTMKAQDVIRDCVRIERNHGTLPNFLISTFQIPGHPDFEQMKNIGEFMTKSSVYLGSEGRPLPAESLREYFERVNAALVREGKTVKLNGDMRWLKYFVSRMPMEDWQKK